MPKCHRFSQMKQLGTSIASPQIGNSVQTIANSKNPKKKSSCCTTMIITEVDGSTGVMDKSDIETGDKTKLVPYTETMDSQAGLKIHILSSHNCKFECQNQK